MARPARILIDEEALRHNLTKIHSLAPKSKVLAMIKANAYGHGIVRVARALHQADAFGVASLEEAECIRKAGIHKPIVLMGGFFSEEEVTLIDQLHCDIVIHSHEQLTFLKQVRVRHPLSIWIKINTGMNRLGFWPEEITPVYSALKDLSSVVGTIRLITHFAQADSKHREKTLKQLHKFQKVTKDFTEEKSLSNSAGILNFPEAHADWVRPGLLLYGASPLSEKTGIDLGFRPAMIFRTELQAVRHQKKGDTLGYGGMYRCLSDMPIGIMAAGYGDGYPFHITKKTVVLIKDTLCPVLGRIAMDMIAVDLRPVPGAKVGDEIILWGNNNLLVEHVAKAIGTIPYTLLCGIAPRVHGAE